MKRPYKKIPKSDRVRMEIQGVNFDGGLNIYGLPEQFEPYFTSRGIFRTEHFLQHLDSYRTCGYVWRVKLDNVRVVAPKPIKAQDEKLTHQKDVAAVAAMQAQRDLARSQKITDKAVGWWIYPTKWPE